MRKNKMFGGVFNSPIFKTILAFMPFGLILLVLFYGVKPFLDFFKNLFKGFSNGLDTLGITASAAAIEVKEANSNSDNPFNPTFHSAYVEKYGKSVKIFTQSYADALVKRIYDSIDFWTPSEFDECFAVFKLCKYKTQVSFLSDCFNKKYKKDLLTYMQGGIGYGLPDFGLKQIIDYVNSLPIT